MANATLCEEAAPGSTIPIVTSLVVAVGLAVMIFFARRHSKLRQANLDRKINQIQVALLGDGDGSGASSSAGLQYPMCLVKAEDFFSNGHIVQHEELRWRGQLVVLDSLEQLRIFEQRHRICFFSHQWTSLSEPDHTRAQYHCMVGALQRVQTANAWPIESTYVWLDYCSVPQLHRPTQELAIASIAIYASRAHVFVTIVPEVIHRETQELCCAASYQGRLWPRAECALHLLSNGTASMWISTSQNDCVPMTPEWLSAKALNIFGGKATCCASCHVGKRKCDRELLVAPLLSMYGKLYAGALVAEEKKRAAQPPRRRSLFFAAAGAAAAAGAGGGVAGAAGGSGQRSKSPRNSIMSITSLSRGASRRRTFASHLDLEGLTLSDLGERSMSVATYASAESSLSIASPPLTNLTATATTTRVSVGSEASVASSIGANHDRSWLEPFRMISHLEEIVFPATFAFKQEDGTSVERELFGDLLELTRNIIMQDKALRHKLEGQQQRLHTRRHRFDQDEMAASAPAPQSAPGARSKQQQRGGHKSSVKFQLSDSLKDVLRENSEIMHMAHQQRTQARARRGVERRWSFGGEQPTATSAWRAVPNVSIEAAAGLDERLSTAAHLVLARRRVGHWQAMHTDAESSHVPSPGAQHNVSLEQSTKFVVTDKTRNEWKRNARSTRNLSADETHATALFPWDHLQA